MINEETLEPKDIDESVRPFWAAFKRTWCKFCTTTSIHGLKFTNEATTNRFIKGIWWIITIISFICSISMVVTFYADYRSNPTRMNLENDHTPVESLLFPSLTVCPNLYFNTEKAEKYIGKLKLPKNENTRSVVEKLGVSTGFMDDDNELFDIRHINVMEEVLNLNNLSVNDFFDHLKWDCNDLLFRCRFSRKIRACDELFQIANTFFGFCCAFNLNQTGIHFTNKRARPGHREGMSLILYYNDSLYDRVGVYSLGFKILVEETPIFPSAQSVLRFVPLNEEVFAAIRPVETFCSSAVQALPIEKRQCVFPEELPLKYFDLLSGPHCELDCRVINTVKLCNCVPYYVMHNKTKDRTCTFKDIPCLTDNFPAIIGRFRNTQCSCPNECEMMDYDIQMSSSEIQFNIPTIDPFYDGIQKGFAIVHVYMNSQVYRRVRRDLLSSTVTLVSNLGSAFSLFVGMSMVSLVEIIYYFTVVLHKYHIQELKARKKILFQRKTMAAVTEK